MARCGAWGCVDVALVVGTVALYVPVLRGAGFVWDDTVVLDRNSLVRGEAHWGNVWVREDFPLSIAVFALLHGLWGKNAEVFHTINLGLHVICAVLLRRVLARAGMAGAGWGAAWFAWHPMAVMSVAWISELKNTLSLSLLLGSAWAWLGYARSRIGETGDASGSGSSRRKIWGFWAGAWALFGLALLAKTSAVALPVVLLAWVYWRTGRLPRWSWSSLGPFFVLGLLMGLRTIWLHHRQVLVDPTGMPEVEGLDRLLRAGWIWWFYLTKAIWPASVCVLYPGWGEDVRSVQVGLAGAGCLLIAAVVVWRALAGRRGGLSLVAAYTGAVFPFLGFVDMYYFAIAPVSDHFAYVALAVLAAGTSSLAAWARECLRGRSPTGFGVLTVLMAGGLGVLGFRAHEHVKVFRNERTLWESALHGHPEAWLAHNNLAVWWAEQGELARAAEHFQRSLELFAGNAAARVNLARIRLSEGRWSEAEEHLRQAVAAKPSDADALVLLAQVLEAQQRWQEAVEALRAALVAKEEAAIRVELAALLRRAGDPAGAIGELEAALARYPEDADVLNNLAWMLATTGRGELRDPHRAVELAQRACRLRPEAALPHGTLAAALAAAGRFAEAAVMAETAATLAEKAGDRAFAELNRKLGGLYRRGRAYTEP